MIDADVAIVGAGPAGLSAALYAARFCRSTLVLHDGSARAARIPRTRNVPGFGAGITGPGLIARMSRHAGKYGAKFVEAHVSRVYRSPDSGFELKSEDGQSYSARALILATGLECNSIPIDDRLHARAIKRGVLRYCPVCDGYEHRGARIGVVGCDVSGASEALFLRQFSSKIHLLTQCSAELTEEQRRDLAQAEIQTVTAPVADYEIVGRKMRVRLEGEREPLEFDVLYAALGTRPRHALAVSLGIPLNDEGKVAASAPFGTSVDGVFCAGDLVEGLDQISVAMGQGAVAATRAHNWLRDQDGQTADAVLDEA
jgi:thioredoxin reductase (NADPH)